jgi:hypothetical protein
MKGLRIAGLLFAKTGSGLFSFRGWKQKFMVKESGMFV